MDLTACSYKLRPKEPRRFAGENRGSKIVTRTGKLFVPAKLRIFLIRLQMQQSTRVSIPYTKKKRPTE